MSNEAYYKALLDEDERLLTEAHEAIINKDKIIAELTQSLQEAEQYISSLEADICMAEKEEFQGMSH